MNIIEEKEHYKKVANVICLINLVVTIVLQEKKEIALVLVYMTAQQEIAHLTLEKMIVINQEVIG